jgi:flagellar biosynthetic protein FliQ
MTIQMALDLTEKTVWVAGLASLPMLATAIIVGVVINVVQAVTQIRDQSLTFVPKAAVALIVLAITMPWVLNLDMEFFVEIIRMTTGDCHEVAAITGVPSNDAVRQRIHRLGLTINKIRKEGYSAP